jgi:hypothetical protein
MKKALAILLCFAASGAIAQNDIRPSDLFTISGEVKNPVTVRIADLRKWKEIPIPDVTLRDPLQGNLGEIKGLRGILLTEILQVVDLKVENISVLSEFYFVCKATDGYAVVYSWNELFNSPTGNTTYLITEKEGKRPAEMNDAILMLSAGDRETGRRYLKRLTAIEVKRAR